MKHRVFIILLLFSLIICFTGVTYSLFNSEKYFYVGNMEIAEFIFDTKRTGHIELGFTDLKPGDTKEFLFEVTNTKGNMITNVTTEYQITIKTFQFMPLIIELYNEELGKTIFKVSISTANLITFIENFNFGLEELDIPFKMS